MNGETRSCSSALARGERAQAEGACTRENERASERGEGVHVQIIKENRISCNTSCARLCVLFHLTVTSCGVVYISLYLDTENDTYGARICARTRREVCQF